MEWPEAPLPPSDGYIVVGHWGDWYTLALNQCRALLLPLVAGKRVRSETGLTSNIFRIPYNVQGWFRLDVNMAYICVKIPFLDVLLCAIKQHLTERVLYVGNGGTTECPGIHPSNLWNPAVDLDCDLVVVGDIDDAMLPQLANFINHVGAPVLFWYKNVAKRFYPRTLVVLD